MGMLLGGIEFMLKTLMDLRKLGRIVAQEIV